MPQLVSVLVRFKPGNEMEVTVFETPTECQQAAYTLMAAENVAEDALRLFLNEEVQS